MTKKSFLKTLLGITGMAWVGKTVGFEIGKEAPTIQISSDKDLKVEWQNAEYDKWEKEHPQAKIVDGKIVGILSMNPNQRRVWDDNKEIGFREDNVVVWREIK